MKVSDCYKLYKSEHLLCRVVNPERAFKAWKNLEPVFGDLEAQEVTADVVSQYSEIRSVSDETLRRELGVLNAALRYCWRTGRLPTVPFIPTPPPGLPRQRVLSGDEIAALVRASTKWPHMQMYVVLLVYTAQRKSAILGLTWDRIDFDQGTIDFNDPSLPLAARRKGRAFMPIPAKIRDFLEKRKRESGYVVSPNGRRMYCLENTWRKMVAEAGLNNPSAVTPHVIRHTIATMLARKGVSMDEIANLLAHRDTRITKQTYVKYSPDFLKRATDAMTENYV